MKRSLLIFFVVLNFSLFGQNTFKLGDYVSIKNHPKSKGVDLKLRAPLGWELKEGDRPNIVKKFTKDASTYLILIKENITFFSRKMSREVFEDESTQEALITELTSVVDNPKIIDKTLVTVDNYPTLSIKVIGSAERAGLRFNVIFKFWIIWYEDKIIMLQGGGLDNNEFKSLENLFLKITNSVIFLDQYN